MKILITGGCGFIGGALIRKLLTTTDHEVLNLDKFGYASDHLSIDQTINQLKTNKYKLFKINLNNKNKLEEIIQSFEPDLIMHLAAESHVDRSIESPEHFIESNIFGTFNLLESCRKFFYSLNIEKKSKFIFHHISTDEVFGSLGEKGRFSESTPYDPRSPYSASKASSDHLVRSWYHTYGLPVIVTNCSNNFGPWQFPEKLIPLVTLKAIQKEPIPLYGDGSNIRDWLFVEDHVDALLLAALKGKVGETYCIGGYGEKSNKEIVLKICEILDDEIPNQSPHNQLIKYVLDRPGHDQRYAIDPSKLENELGWVPKYGLEKGLRETVLWYLKNYDWCQNIFKKGNYRLERLGK